MANSKQANKRVRQATRRYERNKAQNSSLKTCIKTFLKAAESGADNAFQIIQKQLDQFAAKGVISKNTAARKKSRLFKLTTKKAA